MKVFNLTDVPTAAIKSQSLVSVPIKVGGIVIWPGQSAEVGPFPLHDVQRLITCGALALNAPPAEYVAASKRMKAAQMPPPPVRVPAVRLPTNRSAVRVNPAIATSLPTFLSKLPVSTAVAVVVPPAEPEVVEVAVEVVEAAAVIPEDVEVSLEPEPAPAPEADVSTSRSGKKRRGK